VRERAGQGRAGRAAKTREQEKGQEKGAGLLRPTRWICWIDNFDGWAAFKFPKVQASRRLEKASAVVGGGGGGAP
jgi:hypothetical protein